MRDRSLPLFVLAFLQIAKMPKLLKSIFWHFIIWTLAISFWSLMREFGQELVDSPQMATVLDRVMVHITIGLFGGMIFGTLDFLTEKYVYKVNSLGLIILTNSIIKLVALFCLIIIGIFTFNAFQGVPTRVEHIWGFIFSGEGLLVLFYCYTVVVATNFIKQIDRKFGPGNLFKMLIGSFQKPQEVNRFFLFLDLNDSTAIAEKIGHMKYSQLIQDCFHDLRVVEQYKAEVYQYVGDEAVLTWNKAQAAKDSNAISAFFAFKAKIQSRKNHYEEKYGIIPSFKGGMSYGKIMIAEVGEIKREIAYHGDTINVASRINGICKHVGVEFLISESAYQLVFHDSRYEFNYEKDVLLKGKANSIKVYSVLQADGL